MKRRRSNARTTSPQQNPVAFEKLEDRRLMVTGAFNIPFATDPAAVINGGDNLAGVVDVNLNCTGSLLDPGGAAIGSRHILTAAHCMNSSEEQRLIVGGSGTFDLTFDNGVTSETATIHTADNAAQVRTKLEGLANIGAGNVSVTSGFGGLRIFFTNALNGQDFPLMTVANEQGGATAQVLEGRNGFARPLINQRVTFFLPDSDGSGEVRELTLDGTVEVHPDWSGNIFEGNDIAVITLDQVAPFGASYYQLNTARNEVNSPMFVTGFGRTGTVDDGGEQANPSPGEEYQRLDVNATAGTYRLGMGGDTVVVPWDATNEQIETAIEGLSAVNNVIVRRVDQGPHIGSFEVRFVAPAQNLPQLTVDANGLTGSVTVSTVQDGGAFRVRRFATNEFEGVEQDNGNLVIALDQEAGEGNTGAGDSGGPGFLDTGNGDLSIAGVTSYGDTDASWGDETGYARVSDFNDYILNIVNRPAYDLVFDLSKQVFGNDDQPDQIIVERTGSHLQIRSEPNPAGVSEIYYRDDFTNIRSVTIIGSDDNDTVTLDYSGGDPVPADGFEVYGLGGTDTLAFVTGADHPLTFEMLNRSQGSVTNYANRFSFSGIDRIEGGSGDDEFRLTGLVSDVPLFDGKAGFDSYIINNSLISVDLRLDASLPEGFSGGDPVFDREFHGIERFTAAANVNSLTPNTVVGIDTLAEWEISGSEANYIPDVGNASRILRLENFKEFSAGSFENTFDVYGTLEDGITLRGGAGDDDFQIFGDGTDLSTILGEVRVEGGAGFNSLQALNKEGAPSQVTITQDSITGIAPAAIKYDNSNFYGNGITGIVVWGSDHGDDTFVVDSMFDFNSLRIDGFGGDDHLVTTSDVLATNIIWDGGEGSDRAEIQMVERTRLVTAVDSGTNGFDQLKLLGLGVADLINVRDTSVSNNVGNTTDDIRYDGRTEQLSVLTRAGNDVVTIDGSNAERVYVQSGNGDDVLQVARTGQASEMELRTGKGADRVRVNSTNPNTVVSVKTQHDADRVFVGSTKNRDNGSLDRIGGSLTIDAGISAVNESDRLYINDRDTPGGQIYRINENRVESLSPRIFMGLEHSQFEVLLLDGTDQADEFEVSPSAFTRFVIDGNLPEKEDIDCSDQGDFLNLVVGSGSGRNLQFTNAAAGAGYWGFENGFQGVHFSSIERFNHVERLALGSDAFEGAVIRVLDAETRDELFVIQPYESTFTGGVRVATGDVTGDGIPDIIAAPGAGRAPEVRIYDGVDGQLIESFMAYDQHMWDGVLLATGDVGGSCATDIVTTTGPGAARAEVRVWQNGTNAWEMVDSFLPFGSSHYRGADVAVADFNGDGTADIAVGALHGRAHVAVFDGTVPGGQAELARFLAFDDDFYGGVHVTVGNVLGSDIPELIVSAGHNNWAAQFSSQVHIYDGETLASTPGEFRAPDVAFQAFQNHHENRASTRIEAKDYDQDGLIDEIFAAHGPSGNSGQIHIFEPSNNTLVDSFFELDRAFERGIFMG